MAGVESRDNAWNRSNDPDADVSEYKPTSDDIEYRGPDGYADRKAPLAQVRLCGRHRGHYATLKSERGKRFYCPVCLNYWEASKHFEALRYRGPSGIV